MSSSNTGRFCFRSRPRSVAVPFEDDSGRSFFIFNGWTSILLGGDCSLNLIDSALSLRRELPFCSGPTVAMVEYVNCH